MLICRRMMDSAGPLSPPSPGQAAYEEAIREAIAAPSQTLAVDPRARDPSAHMRAYLKSQSKELVVALSGASESLVKNSKVELGIAVTAKRFAAAETHIDGTAVLLRKMNSAVKLLDDEVGEFVESVTLLEDVADQLVEINKDALKLLESE